MIKVLELFAGIGACSKALTDLGIEHEIVDAVEIDKYAIKSFNAIHGTNFEPQDITKYDKEVSDIDLLMHGSPCQDFSLAGLGKGGDERSGTRSSLMYESIRIIEKVRPTVVIWENVKAILSKKHKHNFDRYQETMAKLGYTNHYQVLNAKDYGVPQNRERVFTVSIRGGISTDFTFPNKRLLEKRLKDVLETSVDEKYYIEDAESLTLHPTFCMINGGRIGKMHDISRRAYYTDSISPTIHTSGGGNQEPKVIEPFIAVSRGRNPSNPSDRTTGSPTKQRLEPKFDGTTNTLTSVQKDNYVVEPQLPGFRVRKLTPKECWRLMGFSDQDFEKASKVNSNAQLYKQAGNSICVPVLENIIKNLLIE